MVNVPFKPAQPLSEAERLQMRLAIIDHRIALNSQMQAQELEELKAQNAAQNAAQIEAQNAAQIEAQNLAYTARTRQEDLRLFAFVVHFALLCTCLLAGVGLMITGFIHLLHALKNPLQSHLGDWGYGLLIFAGWPFLKFAVLELGKETPTADTEK